MKSNLIAKNLFSGLIIMDKSQLSKLRKRFSLYLLVGIALYLFKAINFDSYWGISFFVLWSIGLLAAVINAIKSPKS